MSILRKLEEPVLILGWYDLSKVPDSKEYTLNIEEGYGWVMVKNSDTIKHYLSTHTFYGMGYKYSTKLLQECGFNVVLDNWDKTRGATHEHS